MKPTQSMHTIIAAALAVFCATVMAQPAPAQEVGMVVDYSPARGVHTIRHADGTTVPVKLGTLLVAGDVVQVEAGGRVFVQLNDGTEHDVPTGEWRVPDAKPLGAIAGFLRSLPRLLDAQAHIAASASTRGSQTCDAADPNAAIEAPILREHSKVTSGTQNLALGWFGGCAPFAVSLRRGDVVVSEVAALKRRQHQFADLTLSAGQYQLRIGDSTGHRRAYAIDVVDKTPAPPADLDAADTATATIARALWLAELDDGTWRLESFKTLRPMMAQKERIAALIGDYLLVSTEAVAAPNTP